MGPDGMGHEEAQDLEIAQCGGFFDRAFIPSMRPAPGNKIEGMLESKFCWRAHADFRQV